MYTLKKYWMVGLLLTSINTFAQTDNPFKRADNVPPPSMLSMPPPQRERMPDRDSLERLNQRQMENQMQREARSNIVPFLTRKLELTPEQMKTFMPLYTEYAAKMSTIKQVQDSLMEQESKDLSDEQIKKMLNARMASKKNELKLVKTYDKKFKAILPLNKVYQLYAAESQFATEQMQRGRPDKNEKRRKKREHKMNKSLQGPKGNDAGAK